MAMRMQSEIEDVLGDLDPEATSGGMSRFPGMTYEQGVEATLLWVLGNNDDKPLDD